MTNLLSLIQSAIEPSLTRGISGYLGESESSTKSALTATIPAVLAAIAGQGSTPSGADQLLGTLRSPDIDPELATNLPVALGGPTTDSLIQQGTSLASSIFGGWQEARLQQPSRRRRTEQADGRTAGLPAGRPGQPPRRRARPPERGGRRGRRRRPHA